MSGETGIRDLLTGLYTRDYFDEVIGRGDFPDVVIKRAHAPE